MQEVLSKPEDSSKPLHEQVFYELRLFDSLESLCDLAPVKRIP
jgi:hypothetical protein